jgi:hypothetical protein
MDGISATEHRAAHTVKAFRIGLVSLAFQVVQRSPAVW